jgi:hypothetical protein
MAIPIERTGDEVEGSSASRIAEPGADPRPEDALIDQLAVQVVARGLSVPATLFLEIHRPFAFLASQGLLVITPFLAAFFGVDAVQRWARLLEQPENVGRLVERIAQLDAERACNTRRSR